MSNSSSNSSSESNDNSYEWDDFKITVKSFWINSNDFYLVLEHEDFRKLIKFKKHLAYNLYNQLKSDSDLYNMIITFILNNNISFVINSKLNNIFISYDQNISKITIFEGKSILHIQEKEEIINKEKYNELNEKIIQIKKLKNTNEILKEENKKLKKRNQKLSLPNSKRRKLNKKEEKENYQYNKKNIAKIAHGFMNQSSIFVKKLIEYRGPKEYPGNFSQLSQKEKDDFEHEINKFTPIMKKFWVTEFLCNIYIILKELWIDFQGIEQEIKFQIYEDSKDSKGTILYEKKEFYFTKKYDLDTKIESCEKIENIKDYLDNLDWDWKKVKVGCPGEHYNNNKVDWYLRVNPITGFEVFDWVHG